MLFLLKLFALNKIKWQNKIPTRRFYKFSKLQVILWRMRRNILLIEPNYANKYPPIGLMKIATYHRMLGDEVRFFKGDLDDFAAELLSKECLLRLDKIDDSINWKSRLHAIRQYIKSPKLSHLWELNLDESKYKELVANCLSDFADKFKKKDFPKYDRVYVTTLFTFYWKITVETIEFCKHLVGDKKDLLIGGVLASLLHKELEEETGIKPIEGLLDKPGMLDPRRKKAKEIVIDDLPLDYSILDEIDYQYPTDSAYFTFMTKGCTRKCAFCSVPVLEPTYKPKIETYDKFGEIRKRFGDQQNLLLMDNNVLASPNFPEIIDEIKAMGFVKGAKYIEPNQLEIAVENLKSGYNDFGFTRRAFRLMNELFPRLKDEEVKQTYYDALADYELLEEERATKENILKVYPLISEIYEKHRRKAPRTRYVDFNQGTDCRYVTPELMKKMSEIPIRPLRLAFDHLSLKNKYIEAVRLAAENGISELSNYILYNFHDKPEELYERLKINADLCLEHDVAIFSFPMKYIPLFGEEAKHRTYTGKHWNKKFIRAIQSILNVTRGIVAPSRRNQESSFFEEAFGKNLKEFKEILYMPEAYIIFRHPVQKLGYDKFWRKEFHALEGVDKLTAYKIIEENDFSPEMIEKANPSEKVREFLRHYAVKSGEFQSNDSNYENIKAKYDALIKKDRFIELTLTYDFEPMTAGKKRKVSKTKNIKVKSKAVV